MKIIQMLKRLLDDSTDPVRHCEVYKTQGCAHVDGFLCRMTTCNILADHHNRTAAEIGNQMNNKEA